MDCPSCIGLADSPPLPPSIAVCGRGDVDHLFAAHAAELRRYAQRIVRTRDAAEDVVQDVFLRLWLRRDSLELGGSIRSYLFISTRARAIDVLARARRVSSAEAQATDANDADLGMPGVSAGADAEPAADASEAAVTDAECIARAVAVVLEAMPPRQRAVATRRLRDRRATADVARELGISPRTVEAHVARATKTLRARLPEMLSPRR